MVSTHLKNISQTGSFPQVGVKIKNIWNHYLDLNWHPPKMRWWLSLAFCSISDPFVPKGWGECIPLLGFSNSNPGWKNSHSKNNVKLADGFMKGSWLKCHFWRIVESFRKQNFDVTITVEIEKVNNRGVPFIKAEVEETISTPTGLWKPLVLNLNFPYHCTKS